MLILLCICLFISAATAQSEKTIDEYVQAINDFKKNTENYVDPIDSRHFLNAQSEDILNECTDAGEYDFIVIGGGSTGSVIASLLTEVPRWRVLLLEAGGEESEVSKIPSMATYLTLSKFNWGYKSVPQKNSFLGYVDNKEVVSRGQVLGGCSAINFLIYSRGAPEDFNRWASLGNPGWSYEEVLDYFKKSEQSHIDHPEPGYHGFSGPLYVEQQDVLSSLTYAFLEANQELGRDILYDYNGKTEEGVSIKQSTTKVGQRFSAATAFLFESGASSRDNLKILTNSLVVKILSNDKSAYGVQYVNNGSSFCVRASKEVILSGGVINSPQLLMLSGIGPKEHLQNLNIPLVKDLPGVGSNLWNHISNPLQPFTTNFTFEKISDEEAVRRYLNGKGPLTTLGYFQDEGFVNVYSPDKSRPDIEHIFQASRVGDMSYEYYKRTAGYGEDLFKYAIQPLIGQTTWSSLYVLLHPKSRGSIRLKSNSPFDFPLIDSNYFSDPQNDDLNTLIAGYKDTIAISKTAAMQKYNSTLFPIDLPACRDFTFGSDEHTGCLIKNIAGNMHHYAGSCRMGPNDDSQAVVDNNLRVYGIKNLRLADCSVIPTTMSGHFAAVAYLIGEKLSDFLKLEYGA